MDPSSVLLEQVQHFCINMLLIRLCSILYTPEIGGKAPCCSSARQSSAGTASRERSLGITLRSTFQWLPCRSGLLGTRGGTRAAGACR